MKKISIIIKEILIGSCSTVTTSVLSIPNTSVGSVITSSTALLTSNALLITHEYISKIQIRYTTMKNWININSLSCEKTIKQSMNDKKIVEKEALELKKIYKHFRYKRKEIMKNTQFKLEDVIDDIISRDSFSPEQITEHNYFSSAKIT